MDKNFGIDKSCTQCMEENLDDHSTRPKVQGSNSKHTGSERVKNR